MKNFMKTIRRIGVLILMIALSCALFSCSDDDSPRGSHELGNTGISVYTEMTKVDLEYGSKTIGFPLYFVSDSPLNEKNCSFVRFEGENVDYLENTKFQKVDIEEVTDVKISGKYVYVYDIASEIDIDYFTPMVDVVPPEIWEIRIEKVVVSVGGSEYAIDLEHPVQYHYHDEYNDIKGNSMVGPLVVFTYGLTENYSVNIHNNAGDVLLSDFYFSDFLTTTQKEVYINGSKAGDLDGASSYKVSRKDNDSSYRATIYFNPAFSEGYTSTEFDYILCTAIVDYYLEGDDTVYRMKFPFNSQGIGNRETAEKFLEYVASLE